MGPKATSAPADAIILHAGDNVSAIVNAAPAGATLFFEPGVYRGVTVTPKDGQTFLGAEGAVLNGSAVLTGFTQQGNLWVIGGQTQQGERQATDEGVPGAMRAGYPETVFVDDKPLKPVDALSKVVSGTFYFDYNADKIYIADNPAGHKIEAGKLADAFHGNAQNVTVQNFVVEKYDAPIQHGAIDGASSWTIENNEVRLNYGLGISAHDNSKIIGNFVHDNGQMGLGGTGKNILVEGNEIARNGFWSGIDVLFEGGGFKFALTDGLIVRGNYSHDNNGYGMWTDIDNIHTLYEDNVVVNNTGIGIAHEISYDAIIRNNVIMNNSGDKRGWLWGNQIQIQNSNHVEVYGNKIDMTGGNGIGLIQQDRGSGAYGPHTTTNNSIHDNIIVSHDTTGIIGGAADFNEAGMLNGNNTWSKNQYYMSDVSDRFWWDNEYDLTGFDSHTAGTGSTISQNYPNTDDWLTLSNSGTGTNAGNTGKGTTTSGAGDDTYVVDNKGDVVDEAGGDGTDTVLSSVSFSLADSIHAVGAIENLTLTGSGAINATGNALDNLLTGNSGANVLIGDVGGDTLDGGGGVDTASYVTSAAGVAVSLAKGIIGSGGDAEGDRLSNIENLTGSNLDDTLEGNAGNNKLIGGLGTDTVSYAHASSGANSVGVTVNLASTKSQKTVTAGSDTLSGFENLIGSEFNDTLAGTSGNNVLTGLGGDDRLDGKAGADSLFGGAGNDTYVVDNVGDVVDETDGDGTDTVRSSIGFSLAGPIHAIGNIENLTLTGTGAIKATGNALDNVLIGNSGANVLMGGFGADTLDGGGGVDTASYVSSAAGVAVSLATSRRQSGSCAAPSTAASTTSTPVTPTTVATASASSAWRSRMATVTTSR